MASKELIPYIKQELGSGKKIEEIKRALLKVGWAMADIERATDAVIPKNLNAAVTLQKNDDTQSQTILPTKQVNVSSKKQRRILPRTDLAFQATITLLTIGGLWYGYQSFMEPHIVRIENKQQKNIGDTTSAVQQKKQLSDEPVKKNKEYYNKKYKFTITPPMNWDLTENQNGAAAIFVNTSEDVIGTKKFRANINIVIEETALSLESYANASRDALKKILKNYTQRASRKREIDKKQSYSSSATFMDNGDMLHNEQLLIKNNGVIYILTATTLEGSWGKYQKEVEETLLTFRVK